MKAVIYLLMVAALAAPQASALPDDLTVSGVVTDAFSNAPIALATVSVVGGRAVQDEVTDAHGVFVLTLVESVKPGDIIRLRVQMTGYETYDENVVVSSGGKLPKPISLRKNSAVDSRGAASQRTACHLNFTVNVDAVARLYGRHDVRGTLNGALSLDFQELFYEWNASFAVDRKTSRLSVKINNLTDADVVKVLPGLSQVSDPNPEWFSGFRETARTKPDYYSRTVTVSDLAKGDKATISIRRALHSPEISPGGVVRIEDARTENCSAVMSAFDENAEAKAISTKTLALANFKWGQTDGSSRPVPLGSDPGDVASSEVQATVEARCETSTCDKVTVNQLEVHMGKPPNEYFKPTPPTAATQPTKQPEPQATQSNSKPGSNLSPVRAKTSDEILGEIRAGLEKDRELGELAGCPTGTSVQLRRVGDDISYYVCVKQCFASWQIANPKRLDFGRIEVREPDGEPTVAIVDIPCLPATAATTDYGLCVRDQAGTFTTSTDCRKKNVSTNYSGRFEFVVHVENVDSLVRLWKEFAQVGF